MFGDSAAAAPGMRLMKTEDNIIEVSLLLEFHSYGFRFRSFLLLQDNAVEVQAKGLNIVVTGQLGLGRVALWSFRKLGLSKTDIAIKAKCALRGMN